jgi:hypothetical protein
MVADRSRWSWNFPARSPTVPFRAILGQLASCPISQSANVLAGGVTR